MVKKIIAFVCAICFLIPAFSFALADKLDDVNLCVGNSVTETYYSRGGYAGSVKAANSKIVKATAYGTTMLFSGGIYYGSDVVFEALSVGSTTVTLYSENGAWMGSVKVNVTAHKWEKQNLITFAQTADGTYVPVRLTAVKTCEVCGNRETETNEIAPDEGITLSEAYAQFDKDAEGEGVKLLQERLAGLGYYSKSIDGKYSLDTINAVKFFQKALGLEYSVTVTPELQAVLFSPAAPEKGKSKNPVETMGSSARTLTLSSYGSSIEKFEERLSALGYLSAEKADQSYDSETAVAVMILQMKQGYRIADGSASAELQALLFNASAEAASISEDEYNTFRALIEEALSAVQPTYKVQATAGSNIRSKPSYEADKLCWVNEGELMEYLGEENGWYLVTTSDGTTGYIPGDRAKIVEG